MSVKLTRRQELALIDLGLSQLLESLNIPKPVKKKSTPKPEKKKAGRKWSPEQRAKFQASMKKVWKKRRATSN